MALAGTKKSKELSSFTTKEVKEQKIIQEYLLQLIPPGTKGVIRGNKFNNIVKQFITKLALDRVRFEICFEKKLLKKNFENLLKFFRNIFRLKKTLNLL